MKRIPKRKLFKYNKHREMFPAQNFDKKTGTSVSHKWKMPEGYDEHRLGLELRMRKRSIKELANQLQELNPEVTDLMNKDLRNTVWGMISRFRKEDMQFFINVWAPTEMWAKESSIPHSNSVKEVEEKYGVILSWVPSPLTISILKRA